MPLFIDVHERLPAGATAAALAQAHEADLKTQERHGVNYLRYWFSADSGKAWCLVDAPSPEAARAVHEEAHGLIADQIYPVQQG